MKVVSKIQKMLKHRVATSGMRIVKNAAYMRFEREKNEMMEKISSAANLNNFRHVYQINIQINNRCNYERDHKECPVHTFRNQEVLETAIVHNIVNELASIEYAGIVMFSLYNEPMIDERFYTFCQYTKEKCPQSKIFINTNGAYLNDETIKTVEAAGVDCIFISAYSRNEYQRFIALNTKLALCIYPMTFDKRLDIYTRDYQLSTVPCKAPFSDLCINSRGEVVLCCLDWKFNYIFGDLHNRSLTEIVNSDEMTRAHLSLVAGNRVFDICKRCNAAR